MREIKFKFLLQDKNKETILTESYFLGDLIAPDGYIDIVSEYNADKITHELQFTGLFDKNGAEIYEGDILLGMTDWEIGEDKWYGNGVVKFYNGGIYFFHTTSDDFGYLTGLDEVEVIGNIHENPELLLWLMN